MDAFPEAEWYVALNADIQVASQDISALVEVGESGGYDLIAPLRREPWGKQGQALTTFPTPSQFFAASLIPERLRSGSQNSAGAVTDSTWVGGSCMVIRRSLLSNLRFDERFFMYLEDVDFCRRARDLGARVGVCNTITLDHAVGWHGEDPLLRRKGVEFARSLLHYSEIYGYSQRTMRLAAFSHSAVRSLIPRRASAARAASQAVTLGLLRPYSPGLSELATQHNRRYGYDPLRAE
jgi:GT2 family glycosyltransferase